MFRVKNGQKAIPSFGALRNGHCRPDPLLRPKAHTPINIRIHPTKEKNQGTIGCTPNSVPMVFIVFSGVSWRLSPIIKYPL